MFAIFLSNSSVFLFDVLSNDIQYEKNNILVLEVNLDS